MTVNDAVAKRISKLLADKKMTQYRLEQKSGIQHGQTCIYRKYIAKVRYFLLKKPFTTRLKPPFFLLHISTIP